MGLSLKMQIAYIGVYIVGGETAMACWDWLGSGGIDPTTPGLPRSLPRGVDRAPGPLDLLPGPCRPRRTPARPLRAWRCLEALGDFRGPPGTILGAWRCLEALGDLGGPPGTIWGAWRCLEALGDFRGPPGTIWAGLAGTNSHRLG